MGWLLSATRRGRRGYFARRARLERAFAGPVCGEHLWEKGGAGARPSRETEQTFRWRVFCVWGARHSLPPRKATLFYHSRRGTDKSGNEPEKNDLCITQLRTDICGLCYTVARNEQAVQSST